MKRKDSIDKQKTQQSHILANQLKSRLYDKGTTSLIKVSATVLYHQSRDKSKTTTIIMLSLSSIQLLSSRWAKHSWITELSRSNLLFSEKIIIRKATKDIRKFNSIPEKRNLPLKRKIALWSVEFHLLIKIDLIRGNILELSLNILKVRTGLYLTLDNNFLDSPLCSLWLLSKVLREFKRPNRMWMRGRWGEQGCWWTRFLEKIWWRAELGYRPTKNLRIERKRYSQKKLSRPFIQWRIIKISWGRSNSLTDTLNLSWRMWPISMSLYTWRNLRIMRWILMTLRWLTIPLWRKRRRMVWGSTTPSARRAFAFIFRIILRSLFFCIIGWRKGIVLTELRLWTSSGNLENGKPWRCGTKSSWRKRYKHIPNFSNKGCFSWTQTWEQLCWTSDKKYSNLKI